MIGCAAVGTPAPAASSVRSAATKVKIEAELTYQAIARSLNAAVASGVLAHDKGEAIKRRAWSALLTVRSVYASGLLPSLAALNAILDETSSATGQTVVVVQ